MSRLSSLARAGCVAVLSGVMLGGCDSAREAIGIGGKQSPDEFAVVTRAPLSMPPDYGLRPPRPGAARPQETEIKDSARNLLVSSSGAVARAGAQANVSRGEQALLNKAGATNPDPNIRQVINRETAVLSSQDDSFVDSLIFWQKKEPPGTIVDAEKEAQRLRENAALGQPPTTGATITIQRKPKGWLEGIL